MTTMTKFETKITFYLHLFCNILFNVSEVNKCNAIKGMWYMDNYSLLA